MRNRAHFNEKTCPVSRLRCSGDSVPDSCRSRCRPDRLWSYRVGVIHAYGEGYDNATLPQAAKAIPFTISANEV